MTQTAVEALKRHRTLQLEERLRMGATWAEHDLVFCTSIGTPLDGSHILQR